MTTPKATKYRIRRAAPLAPAAPRGASGADTGAAQVPLAEVVGTDQPEMSGAATATSQDRRTGGEAGQQAGRGAQNDPATLFEPQEDGFDAAIFPGLSGAGGAQARAAEAGEALRRAAGRRGAAAAALHDEVAEAGTAATGAVTVGAGSGLARPAGGHSLAPEGATVISPSEQTAEEEIARIREEGLTGRQLRLARRMAQKHGIEATSDFDAVRLLRRAGIDPFDRTNILQMVRPSAGSTDAAAGDPTTRALARLDGAGADTRVQLPQTVKPGQLPSPEVFTEDHRAREIIRIQRDIAKRRQRKLLLLAVRLAFFVFLPTLIAGYYYYAVATPLYATKSEFVIQKADGLTTGSSGMSGLLSGTQFATNQDAITVQSYLTSRDAMQRLDQDLHFKDHFSTPELDPIQGLEPDASNERAYKIYKRNVKIGYDPSEGIIKMEVIAPNPELSRQFSEKLISYAEEQVDRLTARLREDQMKGARESFEDAEAKVFAAQAKVLELQEKLGIMDPVSESSLVMGQISGFETQLQQKRLELGQLLSNPRPSPARVQGVEGDIARLETLIGQLRGQLTARTGASESLAAVTGQLRIAEAELQTRQGLLAAAAQLMETARIEANKQVRYLEMGVRPIAPDEPTYPRAFENTILAFLIFSGIYLMLSLTASILREQVSS